MTTHRLADGRDIVVDQPLAVGRYNIYDCEGASHALLSLDVDEGVTPFIVQCPDHGASATSRFYRVRFREVVDALPLRMVWRKATAEELAGDVTIPAHVPPEARDHVRAGMVEHYRQGGLEREWVGA